MILSRSPYRISFLGGGTDVKEWYYENGGGVISAAINKYVYVQLKKQNIFFPHDLHHRIIWRRIEKEKNIFNIKNPIVKAAFSFSKIKQFYDCFYSGDLPSMSGCGSSSAFTVALLNSINVAENKKKNKQGLFKDAVHIERSLIKEHGGIQDQFRSAFGGFSYMKINKKGLISNHKLKINKQNISKLQKSLEIYFIRGIRSSSILMNKHKENIKGNKQLLLEMNNLTKMGFHILNSNSINFIKDFSKIIEDSWLIKKSFHDKVSSIEINDIISKAKDRGAYTGKLMGAGSSGFIFFIKNKNNSLNLSKYFRNLVGPLNIEFDNEGVKTIYST